MIAAATKKQIDEMGYESMLSEWRFAPVGTTMFQGETGDYFAKVMREKRAELEEGEHAKTSKRIGWKP